MFRVFYGPNRFEAQKCVRELLGEDYEVFEGENLQVEDLPSVFQGTSLFATEKRRILLKDVSENAAVWEKLANYTEVAHEIICWENKIDKRSVVYKQLKEAGVELREFPELKKPEATLVFGILDMALRDGRKAVEMVEQIELQQDPFMFFGLLVTQMLKKYDATGAGMRERRILKALAETDLLMKSSTIEAWGLVKSFLLRVGKM